MTTLREVRDNWHLLLDREIPRLREGKDVRMLWSAGHYDGPACGVCQHGAHFYWFDRISEAEYRGLEIRNYIYVMVRLSDAAFGLEKVVNGLFCEHVGDYCNYTYKVNEDEDGREYTRIRGKRSVEDTSAGYAVYRKIVEENKLERPFSRYYDEPVRFWWASE